MFRGIGLEKWHIWKKSAITSWPVREEQLKQVKQAKMLVLITVYTVCTVFLVNDGVILYSPMSSNSWVQSWYESQARIGCLHFDHLQRERCLYTYGSGLDSLCVMKQHCFSWTVYTRSFSLPFLSLGTRLIQNKNKMPTWKLLKPTFDKCHQLSICRSGSNDNIIGLRRCCFHWPLCAGESVWHHCSVSLQCTTTSKQCKRKKYLLNSSSVAQLILKHCAMERE